MCMMLIEIKLMQLIYLYILCLLAGPLILMIVYSGHVVTKPNSGTELYCFSSVYTAYNVVIV